MAEETINGRPSENLEEAAKVLLKVADGHAAMIGQMPQLRNAINELASFATGRAGKPATRREKLEALLDKMVDDSSLRSTLYPDVDEAIIIDRLSQALHREPAPPAPGPWALSAEALSAVWNAVAEAGGTTAASDAAVDALQVATGLEQTRLRP